MQITTLSLREYRALTRGILLIEVPHDNQNYDPITEKGIKLKKS